MQKMNAVRRFGSKVAAGATALVASGVALASEPSLVTEAQTAITAAKGDGLTVGGYVVAAVAGLIVISLIISVVRKVR